MDVPKKIWLIDVGDEITWCDCPYPSNYIEERDVVEYVKAEQLEQQAKSIDKLQKLVKDAADYLDINSQTVISNSSILHREFRSLANKYKTNKQDK